MIMMAMIMMAMIIMAMMMKMGIVISTRTSLLPVNSHYYIFIISTIISC